MNVLLTVNAPAPSVFQRQGNLQQLLMVSSDYQAGFPLSHFHCAHCEATPFSVVVLCCPQLHFFFNLWEGSVQAEFGGEVTL